MAGLFDLSGKQCLVTGGAQGLGRMIAEGLLRAGAAVAITSRKADLAQANAAEMSALGPCTGYGADLSTAEAAVELVARFSADVGRCDILVNNAGKTWGASIDSFPDKAWSSVMTVNVQTPFTMIRELLPLLRASGTPDDPARIINIGSVAGAKVERLNSYSYTASKAAIHMLTRELAADLAVDNITVNAIIPGYFPTKMTAHLRDDEQVDPATLAHIPLHRLGRPDDIAAAIIYLSSRGGSYITGAHIPVDGGLMGCG
ncbi:SDR family oxidoreductase [Sphingobium sp. 15-1]|uniref:SDR family oxidoreductase n=1 Tax=Sphingobium sp. 15-1 TaxID=2729616 RepID=UPI00159C6959|nr:SDR family oxidoreductase [Sphingobium sp. 15-1]